MVNYDQLIKDTQNKKFKSLKKGKMVQNKECCFDGSHYHKELVNEIYDATIIPLLHLEDVLPKIKSFRSAIRQLSSFKEVIPVLVSYEVKETEKCQNWYKCALYPGSSKFKEDQEATLRKESELDELMIRDYPAGTMVQCIQNNCKYYNHEPIRVIESLYDEMSMETVTLDEPLIVYPCKHGVPHVHNEQCKTPCTHFNSRYKFARCEPL